MRVSLLVNLPHPRLAFLEKVISQPQQKVSSSGTRDASAHNSDLLSMPNACIERWPRRRCSRLEGMATLVCAAVGLTR